MGKPNDTVSPYQVSPSPAYTNLDGIPACRSGGSAVRGGNDARGALASNYPGLIPKDVLGNKPKDGYRKRHEDAHELDPDAWVFDGSTTRCITDDELESVSGIVRCSSTDCVEEMKALRVESAIFVQPEATMYPPPQAPIVMASTTLVTARRGQIASPEDGLAYAGSDASTHESFAPQRETGKKN